MNLDNRAAAVMGAAGGVLVSAVAGTDYATNGKLVAARRRDPASWSSRLLLQRGGPSFVPPVVMHPMLS